MGWGTAERRHRIAGAVMVAVAGTMLVAPAASAQNYVDVYEDTTTERVTRETTTVANPGGDALDITGGAIFAGDIISGQNTGNDIALDRAAGDVRIDGGDSFIPTYVGMNVGSDANDVFQDGEYPDNDATTDNTVDTSGY